MRWYLKCYYGYKNRWDELLFFGVLDWIKNHTPVTHMDIESGDVQWMESRASMHQDTLKSIWLDCTFVDKKSLNIDLYFFGWGEVINDQDKYILPKNPSLKNYCYAFLSNFFTRSGRNYYLKYRRIIHTWKFFLLWGIGKPYKITSKLLYSMFFPKAKGIVTRDVTSYQLALSYNTHSTLYHDFSQYMIGKFRKNSQNRHPLFKPDSYILINAQDHTWSEKTLSDIQAFVQAHPDKTPVFFPCDMQDDANYFAILLAHIPWLQLYDWTQYTVFETLGLFAGATAGIGSRLHFLYPLHSFGKRYSSTATKDKVAKLLSPTPIDVI